MSYFRPLDQYELNTIFDDEAQKVMNFLIKRAILAQPEKQNNSDSVTFRVPNEHMEQWVAQAIGGTRVGAGSYPIDLISSDGKFGADIAIVTAKSNERTGNLTTGKSGEKSLGQKFSDDEWAENESLTLDQLFAEEKILDIAKSSNNIFYKKFKKVILDYPSIENLYYFFIINHSEKEKFYLFGLSLNLDEKQPIGNPKHRYYKGKVSNVILDNFLDEIFGIVTTYKSKKRIELRLATKFLVDNNYCLTFDVPGKNQIIKLRNYSDEELKEFLKSEIENF